MSIIIKSLDSIPEHCYDCPCHDGESGYCRADKEHRYSDYRPFWCPLQQISNPCYAVEKMKRKIKEHNEFSRDEIDEMYMQDVLKIIDEYCDITEADSEESEV